MARRLPTIRDRHKRAIRTTPKMRDMLMNCFMSRRGLVFSSTIAPNAAEEGYNRTIFALVERKLLRFVPRSARFGTYGYALTSNGRELAAALVNEKMERLENYYNAQ